MNENQTGNANYEVIDTEIVDQIIHVIAWNVTKLSPTPGESMVNWIRDWKPPFSNIYKRLIHRYKKLFFKR